MGDVIFTVTDGEDKGKKISLHFGTCKVVGRNLDTNTTVHTGTKADKMELRQKEIERIKSYLIRYDSQKFYSKEVDFKRRRTWFHGLRRHMTNFFKWGKKK
jgi:hypothetical protein